MINHHSMGHTYDLIKYCLIIVIFLWIQLVDIVGVMLASGGKVGVEVEIPPLCCFSTALLIPFSDVELQKHSVKNRKI